MVRHTKLAKGRLDKYYYLAKEQGYRSRAAYKLVQLNQKHKFLEGAHSLIDLCAAPGGWTQVAAKFMPVGSTIIAVDLNKIPAIPGVITHQTDITSAECRNLLKKDLDGKLVDVVVHDGAPNMGTSWTQDSYWQNILVLWAAKLASEFLKPNGIFVSKVFRSQHYTSLTYALKQIFAKVTVTKPASSRDTSAEIFFVCEGYYAPGEIDPRVLDPDYVLENPDNTKEKLTIHDVVGLKKNGKARVNREGYGERAGQTLFTDLPVHDLMKQNSILESLIKYNRFTFPSSESCQNEVDSAIMEIVNNNDMTNEEIKTLCGDTKVLGKSDIVILQKWHAKIRGLVKHMEAVEDIEETTSEESSEASGEVDEDKVIMDALERDAEKAKKKQKKKEEKRKLKDLARVHNDSTDVYKDFIENQTDGLFESSKHGAALRASTTDMNAFVELLDKAQNAENEAEALRFREELAALGIDDQRDGEDFNEYRERVMSAQYNQYLERTSERREEAQRLRDREKEGKRLLKQAGIEIVAKDDFLEGETEEVALPKINIDRDPLTEREQAWFADDEFKNVNPEQSFEKAEKQKSAVDSKFDDSEDSDSEEPEKKEASIELSEGDYDEETVAERMAIAQKMLLKKNRERMIDDAYNKFAYADEDLPDWFANDEKQFMVLNKPITKREVEEQKAKLRALNAAPIKKVREAKQRKKLRMSKTLAKISSQAENIADNKDMDQAEKVRALSKLANRSLAAKKASKGFRGAPAKGKGKKSSGGKAAKGGRRGKK